MGVISSRIRRHRRTRLAAEMSCTWNPRRLFPLGQEQGGVYYPDNPDSLLRRVNLLSSTATLSTQSITATPRQQTLSFKGTGTVTLSGASTAGPLVGTGASDRVSLTFTPTAASLTLTVTGTVTEAQLELGSAFTTYQPVTTWNTEYMAAVGHLVTQFTDAAGTTAVQKVTDGVGLTLDRRFGGYRGPEQITTQDLSNVAWFSGGGFGNFSGSTVSGNTITGTNTSGSRTFRFAVTPGEMVECTALATYISGTNAQLRITFGTSGLVLIGGATSSNTITSGTGAVRIMGVAPATAAYCEMSLTAAGASGSQAAFTDMSARVVPGNHRIQATSGSRKTLSARVNLLTKTEQFVDSGKWFPFNVTVATAAGTAPDGTNSAISLSATATSTTTFYYEAALGQTNYKHVWYIKKGVLSGSFGNSLIFRNVTTATNIAAGSIDLTTGAVTNTTGTAFSASDAGGGWWKITGTVTSGFAASDTVRLYFGWNSAAATAGDYILVWHPDCRTADDAAKSIPAYQRVNTASDYDTDGFYHANVFDGTDDNDTCATGGGNTSGLMLVSTITVQGGAGTNRVIWSDIGTNTGWRVRINTSNQLEISAGNGSAYTTVATTATLPVGETHVISAWEDGANLCVQIDNGAGASTAKPTISAGTAGFTIGKENGAASGYFFGRIYDVVARWSGYNPTEHARLKTWAGRLAGMSL